MRRMALAAGWALLLSGGAASAQSTSNDDELRRASGLRRDQHPEAALVIYRQLALQTHDPRAIAEQGITEAQMGRWVDAEEHLIAALATDDRWVRHHRSHLQPALEAARQHLADLVVTCNVVGATLRIDGTPMGALPRAIPVRVTVGPVVVDVTADHYEAHRRTVQTSSGTTRVEVTLVPEPDVVAIRPVLPVPVVPTLALPLRPTIVEPARPTLPPATVRVPNAPRGPIPALRVAAFGFGGVGLVLGVTGLVLRNSAVQSMLDNPTCAVTGGGVVGDAVCQDNYNSAQSMQAMSIAGFVAGGVFAAAGVALVFVRPSRSRERPMSWTCAPHLGSIGVGCAATF